MELISIWTYDIVLYSTACSVPYIHQILINFHRLLQLLFNALCSPNIQRLLFRIRMACSSSSGGGGSTIRQLHY